MKLTLFIVLGPLLCSCGQNVKQKNLDYINKDFKKAIVSFTKSLSEGHSKKVVTIELQKRSDSSIVYMANSYPDLRGVKYICSDSLHQTRLLFVGDSDDKIYRVQRLENIPSDVLELNKKLFDPNSLPQAFDPKQWVFYFKGGVLLGFSPKEEIERYFK